MFLTGELLKQAEAAGFDVLLTTNKRFGIKQNLTRREIAIIVLGTRNSGLCDLYLDRVTSPFTCPAWTSDN